MLNIDNKAMLASVNWDNGYIDCVVFALQCGQRQRIRGKT